MSSKTGCMARMDLSLSYRGVFMYTASYPKEITGSRADAGSQDMPTERMTWPGGGGLIAR